MNKEQFDKIRACCLDCAMYFAKGQPDEPSLEEMQACVNSLSAAEIMAMHKDNEQWTSGILKDDIICSYFRKHGL
jgi:hypothetical protein